MRMLGRIVGFLVLAVLGSLLLSGAFLIAIRTITWLT